MKILGLSNAMKKVYFFIILAVTLCGASGASWLFTEPPTFLSLSSPNRIYRVDLRGNQWRPRYFFFEHAVNFDVFEGERRTVKNAYAHNGDGFDPGFEDSYPEHIWVNEQVLRFGRELNATANSPDRISVINRSGRAIKYLRIQANGMFIVLDMAPRSMLELTSAPQSSRTDLSWIAGEGQFADGQSISESGVNFPLRHTPSESLRYCISVEASGLRIESLQNEGYNNGIADKANIPRARSC
jgi:hypothetical protein